MYKQINNKNITKNPFNPNKGFTENGTDFSDLGIDIYAGMNNTESLLDLEKTTGISNTQNPYIIYKSIKQLYYSNYISSSYGDNVPLQEIIYGTEHKYDVSVGNINAPRYDNYIQSTLTQSRYFPSEPDAIISLISIPSTLYGDNIVPTTFKLLYDNDDGSTYTASDDGEGNIYITGGNNSENGNLIGQIFYSHGNIVITTSSLYNLGIQIDTDTYGYVDLENIEISFSSSIDIWETQCVCNINSNEFNYSLNPSLINQEYITGSFFVPYITTIGLYNDNKELLMVGKLSNPIPSINSSDLNFVINIDLI
jgi:hypothetical protein